MDRAGQVWNWGGITFVVLASRSPDVARQWWSHDVAYLEHSLPEAVGGKGQLEEAITKDGGIWSKLVGRVA